MGDLGKMDIDGSANGVKHPSFKDKPSIAKQIAYYFVNYNYGKYFKRKLPVIKWLPQYSFALFIQDLLAGFTVGLTEIPQGIAYAGVAGLAPQFGLYSGFMGGFMYFFFGSCKDLNIGPTAIMSLMVQPHVTALGPDMAVLITFLAGCIIFGLGLFNLGFLVEFFSYPIIAGFTSAGALQIASTQLNSLLGIPGKAQDFLGACKSALGHLNQTRWQDATLGFCSIFTLIGLKELGRFGSLKGREGWSKRRKIIGITIFFVSLSRNAIIVIFGTALAYCVENKNATNPFKLTGPVKSGFPPFEAPPFSTVFNNGTHYDSKDMMDQLGTTVIFAPLIAILESIAIAKAFSKGRTLDATQEMLALGICNIMGSFVKSMPVTGSFTRTAVNNASGVKTTMAGVLTAAFVLLAIGCLTSTFYYIPKATLASVVMVAMLYLFDFGAFATLWRSKKLDLIPLTVTLATCVFWSLEYGILVGIGCNLLFVLYTSARPKIDIVEEKLSDKIVQIVTPRNTLEFPAAEYLREKIIKRCGDHKCVTVLNGKYISSTDATVARSLIVLREELRLRGQKTVFWNFKRSIIQILLGLDSTILEVIKEGDLPSIVRGLYEDGQSVTDVYTVF